MASQEWWEQKEKEFSEKQGKKDQAESDAAKQRIESLKDAARAMDRVGQDFNHKLGWFYETD